MNKTFILVATLSSVLVLTACKNNHETTSETSKTINQTASGLTVDKEHTAENALDWNGQYEGVLPCADCPGIKTILSLNLDKTYTLEETYLERHVKPSIAKGTFKFDEKNGSIIVLDSAANQRQYFIGEGFAEARAIDGSVIDGPLKSHFRLKKMS